MLINCLWVGCGGFAGSVLRYLASFVQFENLPLPVTTLAINILGSFLIMFLTGLLGKAYPLDSNVMLFLRVGLCGGFTTFSTFSAETLGLIEQGKIGIAILYAALSVLLCVAAAFVGALVASALSRSAS